MSKHKEHQHTKQDQQGEGRLYNSNNEAAEERGSKGDISQVDQQEGVMNHGEEGGNFRSKDDQNSNRNTR